MDSAAKFPPHVAVTEMSYDSYKQILKTKLSKKKMLLTES